MQTGTKISGAFHLAAIAWVLFGHAFEPEPLPFEVHEVAVISASEFAEMTAVPQSPDLAAQPAPPEPPAPAAETPEVAAPAAEAPPERQQQPPPQPQPEAEVRPEPVPLPPAPEPETRAPDRTEQPAEPEVAAVVPPPVPPQPRPVERVAPTPVAPPPPEARPDPVATPEVSPDEGAEVPREPQPATAPEEAVDRIVTEAETGKDLAPTVSPRPKARPQRSAAAAPDPAPQPADPQPAPADTRQAVNDALAEVLGDGGAADPAPDPAPVASGPPLTSGEKEALRVAVSACWNVGSLSTEALRTTVVVTVQMAQDGKPVNDTIRMVSSSGGSADAARQAFEAARRAIIRCGAGGFVLPAEKYGQWREIEMTFNPERMRVR